MPPKGEQAVYVEGKGSRGTWGALHRWTTQICFAEHKACVRADVTAQLSFRSPFSPFPSCSSFPG